MLRFGFEDLDVWRKAINFSASIALNIAEGKGRFFKKEFIQFLYIARGSLFETITLLILFHEMKLINQKQLDELKPYKIYQKKCIAAREPRTISYEL